jgi:hypothetical protein
MAALPRNPAGPDAHGFGWKQAGARPGPASGAGAARAARRATGALTVGRSQAQCRATHRPSHGISVRAMGEERPPVRHASQRPSACRANADARRPPPATRVRDVARTPSPPGPRRAGALDAPHGPESAIRPGEALPVRGAGSPTRRPAAWPAPTRVSPPQGRHRTGNRCGARGDCIRGAGRNLTWSCAADRVTAAAHAGRDGRGIASRRRGGDVCPRATERVCVPRPA